jgi:hypothetical protein
MRLNRSTRPSGGEANDTCLLSADNTVRVDNLISVVYRGRSSIGTTTHRRVSACSTIVEHSQQEGFTECRCQRHVKPPNLEENQGFRAFQLSPQEAPKRLKRR